MDLKKLLVKEAAGKILSGNAPSKLSGRIKLGAVLAAAAALVSALSDYFG